MELENEAFTRMLSEVNERIDSLEWLFLVSCVVMVALHIGIWVWLFRRLSRVISHSVQKDDKE